MSKQLTNKQAQTGLEGGKEHKILSRKFNWAVRKAQAAIFAERLWPRTVPLLCAGGLFLTASWFGVWNNASPLARIAGVTAFALAAVASPLLFKTKSLFVKREEAIQRLDGNAGEPTRPALTLSDKVSDDSPDEDKQRWEAHRLNVWKKHGDKLYAGRPRSDVPKRDRFGIRYMIAAAAIGAAIFAGEHRVDNLTEAFNWHAPVVAPAPMAVQAWVRPPDNIEAYPLYLTEKSRDDTQGGDKLVAHENSTLTILTFGQETEITVNDQVVPLKKVIDPRTPEGGKPTYQYEVQLADENTVVNIQGGPQWHINVTPDGAPVATIKNIGVSADNPNALDIQFETGDDFGVEEGEIIIKVPGQDPAAKPLPSGKLPPIYLPH